MRIAFYFTCLVPAILLATIFFPPFFWHVPKGDGGEAQLDWIFHATIAILTVTPVIATMGILGILAAIRKGEPYTNLLFSTLLGMGPGCLILIPFVMRAL